MNTLSFFQNLKLNFYLFNENEKLFVHKNTTKNYCDIYDDSAELIKLVKLLRKHEIKFKEEDSGDIRLIA
jgi:hypothetical protein